MSMFGEPNQDQSNHGKTEQFVPPDKIELDPAAQEILDNMMNHPFSTSARFVRDEFVRGYQDTRDAAKPYVESVSKQGREVFNAFVEAARSFYSSSREIANSSVKLSKDALQKLGQQIAAVFEQVGADPEKDAPFHHEFLKIWPFVGAGKEYADAYRAYHTGKEKGDEEMIKRGEIMCLTAMIDGKLDVVTFGLGRAHKIPRIGLSMLQGMTFVRGVNSISKYNLDPIHHVAKYMHGRSEKLQKLARSTLDGLAPLPKS